MEKKIKEIYKCDVLEGSDPLVVWYNRVIEKTISELSIADVARCIRQDLFIDMAYEMLIVYLLHNPYEGDMYEGEFIEKASEMDKEYVIKYRKPLLEIIDKASQFAKMHEWEFAEDVVEYEENVNKLSVLLGEDK